MKFTATLAGKTKEVECTKSHEGGDKNGKYNIWYSNEPVAVLQVGPGGKLWPTRLTFFEYADKVVMATTGVRLNRPANIVGWNSGVRLSEHNTYAV